MVRRPATLHQLGQHRIPDLAELGSEAARYNITEEAFRAGLLRERDLPSEQLPQNHSCAVNIRLLVVRHALQHLGSDIAELIEGTIEASGYFTARDLLVISFHANR